jgi:hypothetical protein
MVKTTKAQRLALKRVFDRQPIRSDGPEGSQRLLSYRQFRASIQPSFGCDGAVMVRWAGMWLGVERDGYTHA